MEERAKIISKAIGKKEVKSSIGKEIKKDMYKIKFQSRME